MLALRNIAKSGIPSEVAGLNNRSKAADGIGISLSDMIQAYKEMPPLVKAQAALKFLPSRYNARSGKIMGMGQIGSQPLIDDMLTGFMTYQATLTRNSISAPDGSLTATKVELGVQSVPSYIGTDYANIKNNTPFRVTLWAKKAAGNTATTLRVSTNNTVAWSTGISEILNVSTDWQKFTFSKALITSTTNNTMRFHFGNETAGSGAADTTTYGEFHIWGVEVIADHDFTFSRASNATMQKKDGTIGFAPHNLVGYSEDLAAYTLSNVTAVTNTTEAPNGIPTADFMRETTANGNHNYSLPVVTTLIAGVVYTASVYVKANGRTAVSFGLAGGMVMFAAFNIANGTSGPTTASNSGGTYISSAIQDVGNGWYRCSITFTLTAVNSPSLRIYLADVYTTSTFAPLYTGDVTKGVYCWGQQLNAGTLNDYVPTTTAALYAPRFEYENGVYKGLLIEKAATNLVTYSQDFSQSNWMKGGGLTASSLNNLSPEGLNNAARLIASTDSAYTYPNSTSSTSGVSYTFSVWLKSDVEGTTCNLSLVDTAYATIGSVAPIVLTTAWKRYSVTSTVSTAGTIRPVVGSLNNGSSVYLWGAQLETGSIATSYIPTQASQATRAVEAVNISGLTVPVEFSIFIEFKKFANVDGIGGLFAINQSGAETTNRIDYRTQNDISVIQAASHGTGISVNHNNSVNKLSGAFKTSDTRYALNTILGPAISPATISSSLNQIRLASIESGSNNMSQAWIKSFALFNTRLTNAELQTITT